LRLLLPVSPGLRESLLIANVAAQWRAADDYQILAEASSARPLKPHG